LIVLTALNLLNYADRNVLFAVQPLVQDEFHLSKTQIGYLTSAFLGFYMVAAPFVGPLADRYSRKLIIVLGAVFWSALTLLTAFTHNYTELLIRHTLVGIGAIVLTGALGARYRALKGGEAKPAAESQALRL
jgi:MFS family permease